MPTKTTVSLRILLLLPFVALGLACPADGADVFQANRRLGRGVNLGNYLEAPRGQNWGVKIVDEHFDVIKQAGFDSIRLPVRWPDYAEKQPPYTIESGFFKRVDHLLDQAQRVGLNVVLNIHHFNDLDEQPDANRQRFAALWRQIAARYQDRPSSLYFELSNEPHGKLSDVWNEVLLVGLAAVRETNPTRPVIVGPPLWNGIRGLPKLKLPDDPNLIVTVHMYNPFEFTHQGATWTNTKVQSIKDRKWGTAEEVKAVEEEIDKAAAWGKANRRPIYLGEFGAYSKGPLESRIKWTRTVARRAEQQEMSWAYWEFAAGFGVYDASAKQWRRGLRQALLPSKTER